MPIYEYECLACGRRVEALQRFGDPPPKACAECGGKLKKLVSSPSFQFKGSGWYVTDYARAKPEGKADQGDKSDKVDKADKADKAAGDGGGKAEAGAGKAETSGGGGDAKPKGDVAAGGKTGGKAKPTTAKE